MSSRALRPSQRSNAWAAQMALADLPLAHFLNEPLIACEEDEVSRLIFEQHDALAFQAVGSLTVGELRNVLLSHEANAEFLTSLAPGLMPEMAAAVSKLMRVQDLIAVARKIRVVTRFRTTVGLAGRLSTRLQHEPSDRRSGRHRGCNRRRAAAGLGRCGDRDQPCGGRRREHGRAAAPDRRGARALCDPHAKAACWPM